MDISDHVVVRPAGDDDVKQLFDALGEQHFAYFQERLTDQELDLGEILVAWLDGIPVGAVFAFWGLADEDEVVQFLPQVPLFYHFEVHPSVRNRGIGTWLLKQAEERLRRRGYGRVALGVDVANKDARRLYERLGYADPGEPALKGLKGAEPFDILVANLGRELPCANGRS